MVNGRIGWDVVIQKSESEMGGAVGKDACRKGANGANLRWLGYSPAKG